MIYFFSQKIKNRNKSTGLKVSWKLYAPFNNQYKSYIETPSRKRNERADGSVTVVQKSPFNFKVLRDDLDRAAATVEKKVDTQQAHQAQV